MGPASDDQVEVSDQPLLVVGDVLVNRLPNSFKMAV
jgi:hypothetical protein